MKLTLPLPPTINSYWRSVVRGKRAFPILSREAREYKARMATIAAEGRMFAAPHPGPLQGPCVLTARFFRPRRAGDCDGRIKPLLDALQGLAYENDSQLVEIHAYNDHDPQNPRVEVEVEAVGPADPLEQARQSYLATMQRTQDRIAKVERDQAARGWSMDVGI